MSRLRTSSSTRSTWVARKFKFEVQHLASRLPGRTAFLGPLWPSRLGCLADEAPLATTLHVWPPKAKPVPPTVQEPRRLCAGTSGPLRGGFVGRWWMAEAVNKGVALSTAEASNVDMRLPVNPSGSRWPSPLTCRCKRAGTWDRHSTMLISADFNRTSRSCRSLPPTRCAPTRSHNVDEDLSGSMSPARLHG